MALVLAGDLPVRDVGCTLNPYQPPPYKPKDAKYALVEPAVLTDALIYGNPGPNRHARRKAATLKKLEQRKVTKFPPVVKLKVAGLPAIADEMDKVKARLDGWKTALVPST